MTVEGLQRAAPSVESHVEPYVFATQAELPTSPLDPSLQVATTELLLEVHVTVAALVIPAQAAMAPSSALIQFPATAVQQVIVSAAAHVVPAQAIPSGEPLAFQFIVKSCGYVKENSRRKRKKKCVRRIE